MTNGEIPVWEKAHLFFPRRSVDGGWVDPGNDNPIWRRKVNGKWQYKQDPETREQWIERQW